MRDLGCNGWSERDSSMERRNDSAFALCHSRISLRPPTAPELSFPLPLLGQAAVADFQHTHSRRRSPIGRHVMRRTSQPLTDPKAVPLRNAIADFSPTTELSHFLFPLLTIAKLRQPLQISSRHAVNVGRLSASTTCGGYQSP